MIPVIALLVVLGLRDKIVFIAARSEQYLPALIFFAFFPFVDMIVAAKLLIVIVWIGAGVLEVRTATSRNVIPPMVSNTPWLPVKAIKRMHYRNFPRGPAPVRASPRGSRTAGDVRSSSCRRSCCCSRTTTPSRWSRPCS